MIQKLLKQKTVVEQLMEEIKSLIASGEYGVNDRIPPENELAERFGVSRPSVREAIKVFNYLGVLNSQSGKGTYVAERANISTEALTWALLLGSDELGDLLELREVMERRATKQLAKKYAKDPHNISETIQTLEQQIEIMKIAIKEGSKGDLQQADFDFHLAVIGGGDNSLFKAIYSTLQSFMLEEIHRTHQEAESSTTIVKEHQAILDGIKTGDSKKALKAFMAHMEAKCFKSFRKKD